MKILCKLVRNGGSTQVTIPKPILGHLRWRAGGSVVMELTPANTIELRPATVSDVPTPGAAPVPDFSLPGLAR